MSGAVSAGRMIAAILTAAHGISTSTKEGQTTVQSDSLTPIPSCVRCVCEAPKGDVPQGRLQGNRVAKSARLVVSHSKGLTPIPITDALGFVDLGPVLSCLLLFRCVAMPGDRNSEAPWLRPVRGPLQYRFPSFAGRRRPRENPLHQKQCNVAYTQVRS